MDLRAGGNGALLMRKEFTVSRGLTRAVAHVCGLGQYELFLNGTKVGEDLLSPGWTDYNDTTLTTPAISLPCCRRVPTPSAWRSATACTTSSAQSLREVHRLVRPAARHCPSASRICRWLERIRRDGRSLAHVSRPHHVFQHLRRRGF